VRIEGIVPFGELPDLWGGQGLLLSGHRILRYAIGGIWPSQPAALRDWGFGHPRGEVTVLRHFPPILI